MNKMPLDLSIRYKCAYPVNTDPALILLCQIISKSLEGKKQSETWLTLHNVKIPQL